jgi:hypothetical protein
LLSRTSGSAARRSMRYAQPCSRSTAWAVRFRRRRSARCCSKRGGYRGKHFADFGISGPLSGVGALLGIEQILIGSRTHGARPELGRETRYWRRRLHRCFVAALLCGGRPQHRQLEQYLNSRRSIRGRVGAWPAGCARGQLASVARYEPRTYLKHFINSSGQF